MWINISIALVSGVLTSYDGYVCDGFSVTVNVHGFVWVPVSGVFSDVQAAVSACDASESLYD